MKKQELRANLLLLLAAAIWGLAFVAQRVGAQYLGSFSFNGIRFALGSLSLLPLLYFMKGSPERRAAGSKPVSVVPAGILAGCVLFMGASLQQIGLIHTSAGKAAFITGLYIVLVPVLGIFLRQRLHASAWLGVAVATVGLYFLSVTADFTIVGSDLVVLAGAFFWALHILVIDHLSKRVNALQLCVVQFLTCAALSMAVALFFEKITLRGIEQALIPLLYGGIGSVGVAYTLQVLGQKHAKPSHAALVLSMEAVFASLGGWLILQENLGLRG
jgi:drug/metabolite transporter (DMT)-like permease